MCIVYSVFTYLMLLAVLDDATFMHIAVNLLALPTFVKLLRTSKSVRHMLHDAFHARKEPMVATARALMPVLADQVNGVFRNQFSSHYRDVVMSKNGAFHKSVVLRVNHRNPAFTGVVISLKTCGSSIESVSWSGRHAPARRDRVVFVTETDLTGYYAFNNQYGVYTNGIVQCLRALHIFNNVLT